MATLRVDEKGRITLPAHVRKDLDLGPGDTVFYEEEDGIVRIAKAINPFDALADRAVDEYRAGKTRRLRDVVQS